jgi:hypothetical protein
MIFECRVSGQAMGKKKGENCLGVAPCTHCFKGNIQEEGTTFFRQFVQTSWKKQLNTWKIKCESKWTNNEQICVHQESRVIIFL